MKQNTKITISFVVLFFTFTLRTLSLASDPKVLPSSVIGDEAYWVHNARQIALFNSIKLDDFNDDLAVAPVYSAISWMAFKAIGVGFFQIRLFSALASFFSLLIIYFIAKRYINFNGAIILIGLIGIEPTFVAVNRLALPENLTFLLFILSTFYFLKSQKFMIISGFFAGLAFLSKTNTPALPVLSSLIALGLFTKKHFLQQALKWLTGLLIPFIIYGLFIIKLSLWHDFVSIYSSQSGFGIDYFPTSLESLFINLKSFVKNSFWRQPTIIILCLLSATSLIKQIIYHPKKLITNKLLSASIIALTVSTIFMAPLGNQGSSRRWLFIIFALAILAAREIAKSSKITKLLYIAVLIVFISFASITNFNHFYRSTYTLQNASKIFNYISPHPEPITGFFVHEIALESNWLPLYWSPETYTSINPDINTYNPKYFFEVTIVDGRDATVFSQKQKEILTNAFKLELLRPLRILPKEGKFQIEGNLHRIIK